MLNLESAPEGAPLIAACKFGRLNIVRHLVRNGAVLKYPRNGVIVSACVIAQAYPIVQW
jgi:hypothetical protein